MSLPEEVVASLNEILKCKPLNDAVSKFEQLLVKLNALSDEDYLAHIEGILAHVSHDTTTVMLLRGLFTALILNVNEKNDHAFVISCMLLIMRKMQSRNIAFEEQLVELRNFLSERYEAIGDLSEAAAVLVAIPLESGQRLYDAAQKISIYLRVAKLYLKCDRIPEAEDYANRASVLQPECHDQAILLEYKKVYAQVLDCNEKFLEAGQRYADLSIRVDLVDETNRMDYLEHALAAAILSGAGQLRTRLLTTLYKDERCQSLEAYPILERMYLSRFIDQPMLKSVEPLLNKHYVNILGKGEAKSRRQLLELAILEHNMTAASHIYKNITLDNLGKLLGVSSSEAERIASKMISEDRLIGCIDQLDGVINFDNRDQLLHSWSAQIESLCMSVNHIVEGIEKENPEWFKAQQLQSSQLMES